MKDRQKEFSTKSDLKSLETNLRHYMNRFATKDDLKRLLTKDDLKGLATKYEFKRLAVKVANLAGEMAELKERIPPRSYFSKLMEMIDGMARSLEVQNQRLAGQAMLWQDLRSDSQKHRTWLEGHELRIVRLESKS